LSHKHALPQFFLVGDDHYKRRVRAATVADLFGSRGVPAGCMVLTEAEGGIVQRVSGADAIAAPELTTFYVHLADIPGDGAGAVRRERVCTSRTQYALYLIDYGLAWFFLQADYVSYPVLRLADGAKKED